jgi:hypothetical protein
MKAFLFLHPFRKQYLFNSEFENNSLSYVIIPVGISSGYEDKVEDRLNFGLPSSDTLTEQALRMYTLRNRE